jgi:hypothetical protein
LIVGGFDASLGMQTAVNSVAFLLTLRALTMAVGSRLSTKDAVAVQNVLETIAGYHYR